MNNIRKAFNQKVREWGNRKQPGFGNMLTADVNCRRIGATTGAITPVVVWYGIERLNGMPPIEAAYYAPFMAIGTFPLSGILGIAAGIYGYKTGAYLDELANRALRYTGLKKNRESGEEIMA